MSDIKFDFDDVLIMPAVETDIESRYAEVTPYYDLCQKLPLFTAPMDTVVNYKTQRYFKEQKIGIVLPRTETLYYDREMFSSYGFDDFKKLIKKLKPEDGDVKVLLDVANGHMNKVLDYMAMAKEKNPFLITMAGNIANPNTYERYLYSGVVDYARIGIGNGNGCLTTQQCGVGYPMGSLIKECYNIKSKFYKNQVKTKIVADGGMKDYADVIKALALGADFVMIGSMFNKALESAAPTYFHRIKLNSFWREYLFEKGYTLHKEFRGMSTKKSQKLLGSTSLKTSEGVTRYRPVEYTLARWVENFKSYLRSAMSYSNVKTLPEFIGKASYIIVTENSFNRYKK